MNARHRLKHLDQEIRDHLARETQDLIDGGMSEEAAQFAARRKFGNIARIKEDVRAVWVPVWVEQLAQDLRYGLRTMRRSPGVTAVAVLTLALGVGVNTALFSLVDGVVLKPLPYAHADRMVGLWEQRGSAPPSAMSTLNYLDYASQSTVFEHIAATTGCCGTLTLNDGPTPEVLIGLAVSPPYFDVFGATAALGRTFRSGDDQPGRDHVVVLSHKLWSSRFGSDRALIGRPIRLNGELYTVLGVMPANGPFDRMFNAVWVPLVIGPERMNRNFHWLISFTGGALARLKPGVTLAQARREMDVIADRLARTYPATNSGWRAAIEPYASMTVGKDLQQSLFLLFVAVALVLLIGCVNLASLLLARGLAQEREVAVRIALGAGRGRLLRQFVTESLLLSLIGGFSGLAVGEVTIRILQDALRRLPFNPSMPPNLVPPEAVFGLDGRVLLFTVTLSVLCGVTFGLVPGLAVIRTRPENAVAVGRHVRPPAQQRLHRGLIVAEVTLAFVLLTSAGLLMRSVVNLRRADMGVDETNVLTAALPFREHRFAQAEQLQAFIRQVVTTVKTLPGVRDVAFTDGPPLGGVPSSKFFQVAGRPRVERAQQPVCDFKVVTPEYFRAVGLRVRRGRALNDTDRADTALVAVINETMARMYFPDTEPVGQRLLMQKLAVGTIQLGAELPWEIVGVIADERLTPFNDTRVHPAVYVANEQSPTASSAIVVRTDVNPARMERPLRQAIAAVDPDQAVTNFKTLDALRSESMTANRLRAGVVGLFAAAALVLCAIGIAGVIAYTVVQRTPELGVRAALGGRAASLVALIMWDGMLPTALGLGLGCIAALGTARLLRTFLFGVGSADPLTVVATAGVLAIVAALAAYLPARRATRIDPIVALRAE